MQNETRTKQTKYLIDTCAFVVFEELYSFDNWKPVWDFLTELAENGVIYTTDDVVEELKKSFNELKITEWVKKNVRKLKIIPKKEHFEYLQNEVYPKCPGLIDPNISNTLYADPILVAVAGYESLTLVTDEVEINVQPNTSLKKLKLPNHCKNIGADCISGRFAWPKVFEQTGFVMNNFKAMRK